jgi:hypothetical protein
LDAQPIYSPGLEADIDRLERMIRQLKIQYDMFFAGGLKQEPFELRRQVDRLVKMHLNSPIPKYAQRFRFHAVVSRYNSMSELWGKTLRAMEEGDHRSLVVRSPDVRERLLARCKVSNPGKDEEALKALYRRFVDARQRTGEAKRQISYQKFVRGVSRQTENLQKTAGCAEIELRLVIQDQKVQLKARPGR